MTATVVRFDAELVVHTTAVPLGCGGGVVVTERLIGMYGDYGSVRRVVRCVLRKGHRGDHSDTFDDGTGAPPPARTTCGLTLTDGAWIDWTAGDGDARCCPCHGDTADEQGELL